MSDQEIEQLSPDVPLELQDVVVVETNDGEEIEFEVVGIVEDDEGKAYAICYAAKLDTEAAANDESEGAQPFIVTDAFGQLVRNPELAQSILDDFLILAGEEEEAQGDHDHSHDDHDHGHTHQAEGK